MGISLEREINGLPEIGKPVERNSRWRSEELCARFNYTAIQGEKKSDFAFDKYVDTQIST